MTRTTTFVSRPAFIVDPGSVVRNQGRQIDWPSIPAKYRSGAILVKLSAAAAQAAVSLAVDPLPEALEAGTGLDFGADGYARVSAAAAKGATVVAVDALPLALLDNAEAYVGGKGKHIAAGTVMAELTSRKIIPRAAVTGAETASMILETNADEDSVSDSKSGYGCITSASIFENLLPEAAGAPAVITAGWKTELRASGGSWIFEQYGDNRA